MKLNLCREFGLICAFVTLASCSANSAKQDSYTMPKGGMSSVAHEMPIAKTSGTPIAEKAGQSKTDSKFMGPKQGMGSVGHEMK